MAKAGALIETMFGGYHPDGLHMSNDPASESRPSGRAVSVFGQGRALSASEPGLDIDDLRSALLPTRHDPDRLWADLPMLRLDSAHARMNHLLETHRDDPVGLLYDHLRTRLLQGLAEHGWSRVAIAAPTRGCGASTVAANLALSLGRRPSGRTVLIDLDLRKPGLAPLFGHPDPGPLRDMLTGAQPIESHFCRVGRTLALGLNGRAEPNSAELLQEPATADALEAVIEDLSPDVTLYDLPPVLETDDVLAFLPEVDGILLIADGTRTTAEQIRDCERLLKDRTQLLGVVLNRAEDSPAATRKRRG